MNETSKRIKAYKEALPGLRERVAGVALLLVMSLVMMTSASFAWLTLSRAPEVSSAATTVTANGNLEIALSNPEGDVPEESMVGDSSKKQAITLANLTWGNLVNLSDPSYGLDSLTLRPAMLGDTTSLFTRPLVTVNYGHDGRAEASYNYELAFTNWDSDQKIFSYSDEDRYGVRAISTVAYDIAPEVYNRYSALYGEYSYYIGESRINYQEKLLTDANVEVLTKLITDYMVNGIGTDVTEFTVAAADVQSLYNMMLLLLESYRDAGEAMARVINIEYFNNLGVNNYGKVAIDEADLWVKTEAELFNVTVEGTTVKIPKPSSYDQYMADIPILEECITYMKTTYCPNGTWLSAQWTELESRVNQLAVISTCRIIMKDGQDKAVSALGGSFILSNLNTLKRGVDAYITQGLIYNFEAMAGTYMDKSATITAMGQKIPADHIRTYAHPEKNGDQKLTDDVTAAYDVAALAGASSQIMAQDTYGMAVDFWVRTNAPDSCLVLEGNVLTITHETPATKKLADGTEVALYSAVVTYEETDEEGNNITDTVDVYYLDPNGTPDDPEDDVAYFADTSGPVWYEDQLDETTSELRPSLGIAVEISDQQKIDVEVEVVGFEGENRVWDDEEWAEEDKLSVDSTTQGNGSCYVFYSNNPADQQNSLTLLSNLRVAFLDHEGVLLAKGRLNTDQPYEESGKVTVPLQLFTDETTNNTTRTEDGDLAIMALPQNEATWITMIVYLEGTDLTNQQVLAAGEIDGQLNVQFGSSTTLVAMGDDALKQEELYVTATLEGETEFDYGEDNATVDVIVTVEGAEPETVTGFFIRQVNANQGSREQEMRFDPVGNGVYKASYTFTSPGTYVFRSVTLDGQEHDLNQLEPLSVVVNGFAINYIECDATGGENSAYVLKESSSFTTGMELKFSSSKADETIGTVQLQFVENDTREAVTTKMTYNPTDCVWRGNAKFLRSGEYTLTYVILDDQYTELQSYRYQLDLVLGVYAVIDDNKTDPADRNFVYQGSSFPVEMEVKLYDGNNDELFNIGQVELYYKKAGSTVKDDLYTAMTWDGQKTSHMGNFQLEKTGSFSFDHVTITVDGTKSDITKAKGATPVYTVMPPDPPEYKSAGLTAAYQLVNSSDAVFKILLDHADSLSDDDIAAVITSVERDNLTDRSSVVIQTVPGVRAADEKLDGVTYSCFTFAVPYDSNYGQDGLWQLTALECYSGYDTATGQFFSQDNPLVLDVADKGIVTEVQTPVLTVSGTNQQLNGAFGSTASANNNIAITVKDKLGNVLDADNAAVNSITATYVWENNSDIQSDKNVKTVNNTTYYYGGGYTGRSSSSMKVDPIPLTLTKGAVNGAFTQTSAMTLRVAGLYTCSGITVTIGDEVYSYNANSAEVNKMPFNAFQMTAVSAAITSPAGNPNAATVSIVDSSQAGTCSTTYNYTAPGVGITLSGMCTGATAALNFTTTNSDGIVRLYGASSGTANRVDGYSWSSNTAQTLYVGFAGGNGTSKDHYVAAGTLTPTANGLVVTYNSVEYYFPVNITITGNGPS